MGIDKKLTGSKGEEAAAQFLLESGYSLLYRNWKWGSSEVDIIAKREDEVIFVEVKTKSYASYIDEEEPVTYKQRYALSRAADQYMELQAEEIEIRFDVITVFIDKYVSRIIHWEDAFDPVEID